MRMLIEDTWRELMESVPSLLVVDKRKGLLKEMLGRDFGGMMEDVIYLCGRLSEA